MEAEDKLIEDGEINEEEDIIEENMRKGSNGIPSKQQQWQSNGQYAVVHCNENVLSYGANVSKTTITTTNNNTFQKKKEEKSKLNNKHRHKTINNNNIDPSSKPYKHLRKRPLPNPKTQNKKANKQIHPHDNNQQDVYGVRQKASLISAKQLKQQMKSQLYIEMKKKREENRVKCRYFFSGKCTKGDACTFSHDISSKGPDDDGDVNMENEQKKSLTVCKFYLTNQCNKGDACPFLHGDFPCKFYHLSRIGCRSGSVCRFSHKDIPKYLQNAMELCRKEMESEDLKNQDKMNNIFTIQLKEEEYESRYSKSNPNRPLFSQANGIKNTYKISIAKKEDIIPILTTTTATTTSTTIKFPFPSTENNCFTNVNFPKITSIPNNVVLSATKQLPRACDNEVGNVLKAHLQPLIDTIPECYENRMKMIDSRKGGLLPTPIVDRSKLTDKKHLMANIPETKSNFTGDVDLRFKDEDNINRKRSDINSRNYNCPKLKEASPVVKYPSDLNNSDDPRVKIYEPSSLENRAGLEKRTNLTRSGLYPNCKENKTRKLYDDHLSLDKSKNLVKSFISCSSVSVVMESDADIKKNEGSMSSMDKENNVKNEHHLTSSVEGEALKGNSIDHESIVRPSMSPLTPKPSPSDKATTTPMTDSRPNIDIARLVSEGNLKQLFKFHLIENEKKTE
ncbi:hypothetical protein SNEBB_000800 [Seison nebaliae]|nr:hypothetical protein SNEBB_000800 [Seison nebaliae]